MPEREIVAEVRGTGKSEARRLRREGYVPAVLYGHGVPGVALKVDQKELARVVQSAGGRSVLVRLQVKGEGGPSRTVMLKELQRHPIRGSLVHCDFYQVSLTERVHVPVPVVLVGEEEAKKAGGMVQHQMREVMVECLPTDIPERFTVDVSALGVGHHVSVSQLEVPPGVRLLSPGDEVVVTVLAPKAEEVPEAPAREEAAAPAGAPPAEGEAAVQKPEKGDKAERGERPEKKGRE
ncbi:MAG: 50S ribosomal protein L25 [Acetobacteraceae bacterium]|nr:50S ribosomal protein L25 [Acetobacteraceae bacterium]